MKAGNVKDKGELKIDQWKKLKSERKDPGCGGESQNQISLTKGTLVTDKKMIGAKNKKR